MKVAILAGGKGTRLQEETKVIPKPMIEIGGKPLLWHIMKIYMAYGFNEFVIALGYKGYIIEGYFGSNYHGLDAKIEFLQTGEETQTGGRVKRLAEYINEPFFLTYGDGVADINIGTLLSDHEKYDPIVTITAVHPPARFGRIQQAGRHVTDFIEKPTPREWINGGFFVITPHIVPYISGDNILFEQEPLRQLAHDGKLIMYGHEGFWACVDTLRDVELLERLWKDSAPWKIWKD